MNWITKIALLSFFFSSSLVANDEKLYQTQVEITISCPMSKEFQTFVNSIPRNDSGIDTDFEEWKSSFVENMTKLIELVESEKVSNSSWSVTTDALSTESQL